MLDFLKILSYHCIVFGRKNNRQNVIPPKDLKELCQKPCLLLSIAGLFYLINV